VREGARSIRRRRKERPRQCSRAASVGRSSELRDEKRDHRPTTPPVPGHTAATAPAPGSSRGPCCRCWRLALPTVEARPDGAAAQVRCVLLMPFANWPSRRPGVRGRLAIRPPLPVRRPQPDPNLDSGRSARGCRTGGGEQVHWQRRPFARRRRRRCGGWGAGGQTVNAEVEGCAAGDDGHAVRGLLREEGAALELAEARVPRPVGACGHGGAAAAAVLGAVELLVEGAVQVVGPEVQDPRLEEQRAAVGLVGGMACEADRGWRDGGSTLWRSGGQGLTLASRMGGQGYECQRRVAAAIGSEWQSVE
jgi:hypothetical protein